MHILINIVFHKDQSDAVLRSGTFGNIGSIAVSLSSQTELPASLLGSAFLLTVGDSWNALGVIDALLIFIRTLLLDTLDDRIISDDQSSGFFSQSGCTESC